MRIGLLVPVLVFGIGAAAVGCGDDSGLPPSQNNDMSAGAQDMAVELDMSIPDDAKRIVTFTMFAADFAQALCTHYMKCGQLDSAQMLQCIERYTRHTGWDQDVEIMKGRMEINELQCLAAVDASRCDSSDISEWSSRCLRFLYTGHQPIGAACIAAAECTSGYCQHAGSDAGIVEQVTGCPGMCATPKSPGSSCRLTTDCASGSACNFSTGQCYQLGAAGDPCPNALGKGSGSGCSFGLYCPLFPTVMPPTCQTAVMHTSVGDPCDPLQGAAAPMPECATGMYCQLQYTQTTTACTGVPSDCGTVPYGYCNVTAGFCMAPSGGKCEPKLAAAAVCDPHNDSFTSFANDQCADGTLCQPVSGQPKSTCQPYGGANADCTRDTSCKIGFYCKAGKCTPWFSDGQVCDTSPHCPSSVQYPQQVCIADNADAGSVTTCEVAKNFGATCTPGFEDALCEPSDLPAFLGKPSSTYCAPTGTGGGTCTPRCY